MPTNRKVIDFKIHNLTEEQFQELKEAGQIDPNAIYCTPDETVANFEAVNARIDETNKNLNTVDKKVDDAIQTEQQHNIEINARVDETVANFEEINTEIEALKDKGGIPLLAHMWADHTLNDMSWLNADTFSWQSGDVYVAAYEHLREEFVSGEIKNETIAGITITYKQAEDGHKICTAQQEANIQALYEKTGVAWYYILDAENKQFKLPRTKFGFTGLRDEVGGYVPAGLPNIIAEFAQYTPNVGDLPVGRTYGAAYGKEGKSVKTYSAPIIDSGSGNTLVGFDASRSSSVYGNNHTVQPRATQMYLYFYVGNFEQSALEQTAGLSAELFNGKADTSSVQALESRTDALESRTDVLEEHDYVVASQKPTSANNYTWFRKYKSGWVEQGGRQYGELTAVYGEAISFGIITLPVPMSNGNSYYAGAIGNGYTCLMNVHPSATTIKFDFGAYTTNRTLTQVRWFVAGYAA